MPIGRFFRRREEQPERETGVEDSQESSELEATVPGDPEVDESVPPEFDEGLDALELSWRERAAAVIPGGTSTGSKQAAAIYGEGNEAGPTHYLRAAGCHVVTPGEQTLIDCTMALGAVSVGYADDRIVRAAITAAANGNVAGLGHVHEVEIAERLVEVIPCAERVRFMKSGAEAVAAAVRLARVSTGRSHVVGCGYFGWLDWSRADAGVPAATRADFTAVPFDDAGALERACRAAGGNLAAVVLEPVIERMPDRSWTETARRLSDEMGAVLVFDELKTGFRLARGGYQELESVTPDLAVFGKAMGGGFPIAAVLGRADVMDAADRTWISSTLAGEAMALAAVGGVLDWYEEADVCTSLGRIGGEMRAAVAGAVEASGLPGVAVEGLDQMWFLRFEDAGIERRFLELAVGESLLLKRGPYNYACLAHGEGDTIVEIERAASSALVALMDELRA